MSDDLKMIVTIGCDGSNCPTIYQQDADTYVVQGFNADGLFTDGLPQGEQAVSVPATLIADLVKTLNG